MSPIFQRRYDEFTAALSALQSNEQSFLQQAKFSVELSIVTMQELRTHIFNNPPHSPEQEIDFFKTTKPMFQSQLIYWLQVFRFELGKTAINSNIHIRYIQRHLTTVSQFFTDNQGFYRYYRSGQTRFDKQYFLRSDGIADPELDTDQLESDPAFFTTYDHKVAKFMAHERFAAFLNTELAAINSLKNDNPVREVVPLKWTSTTAGLVELLYAFHGSGVFNHGNSTLAQLAVFFEEAFDIRLGNYYRSFQEIRIRKKSRTLFLDSLREKLLQRMDQADENPR
jgi:hypothetical protein